MLQWIITLLFVTSWAIRLGWSQIYSATYQYTLNTLEELVEQVRDTQSASEFYLPLKVVFEYTVITDGNRYLLTGKEVSAEGLGLAFTRIGPTRGYVDISSGKVVLQEEKGDFSAPLWLYHYTLGTVLQSDKSYTTYQLASPDSGYSVTFCDTIPAAIHPATPIRGAIGGVTGILSPTVQWQLMGWQTVQHLPASWPDFPIGKPAKDQFFKMLPDERAMWQKVKANWQNSRR